MGKVLVMAELDDSMGGTALDSGDCQGAVLNGCVVFVDM